jgi:flagellar biosynthetic protein FlhB
VVPRSLDASAAIAILTAGALLAGFGSTGASSVSTFTREVFTGAGRYTLTTDSTQHLFVKIVMLLAVTTGPFVAGMMAIGLTGQIAQVGFKFTPKLFEANFQRMLNFGGAIKRMFFSKHVVVELAKSFVKFILLGAVLYNVATGIAENLVRLMGSDMGTIASFATSTILTVIFRVAVVYAAIAAFDVFWQRREWKRNLMMTKQEVKEENKQHEGDVGTRLRMRSIARQRLRKLMLQKVRKADVVITNPTHVAVALQYDPENMGAPVLVAKGAELLAAKIKEIAKEAGVPIVEEPALARALYASVEIDQPIPMELYKAVAQVLALIFKARGMAAKRAA